jgi:two-component system response regulator AtoC
VPVAAHDEIAILVAVADSSYGHALASFLERRNRRIDRAEDAPAVLQRVGRRAYDVVLLDVALDSGGDVDLVSYVLERHPLTRVILLFEPARMERALDGVRQGAFFYLPMPTQPSDVALVVEKALRNREQEAAEVGEITRAVFEEFAGHSPAMKRVAELVRKVAPTDSTVLLLGESGTGKEVLANTIHRLSRRRDKPFIAVNCAALPEGLLESELFGHVKGAFTGADRDKVGLFEEASGGTILLDEIGDMALVTQAKLLRVLQSGEIRPVGSSTTRLVDVRVLAATNVDLVKAVAGRQFREDLYFRLNVIQIRIPPLRERLEALPQLVDHFLRRSAQRFGKAVTEIDDHAMGLLRHYHYPGNVRELESIIAHAVIMADTHTVCVQDLPESVREGAAPRFSLAYDSSATSEPQLMSLADMEAQHIRLVLEQVNGNQTQAAKVLGISRSTLWRKMSEYGLGKADEED